MLKIIRDCLANVSGQWQNGNLVTMNLPGEDQLFCFHAAGNDVPVPENRVFFIADSRGNIQPGIRRSAEAPMAGINSVIDGPKGSQILKLIIRCIFFGL